MIMKVLSATLLRQLCSFGSEANLCWPFTSLVLLAPFVWLTSECDTLPIVPLSEPHTPEAGFTEEKETHAAYVFSSSKQ